MPRASAAPAVRFETVADVLKQLGDIAPHRVRLTPSPGKATERDLLALLGRTDQLYELVDGTLVEKVMAILESGVAAEIVRQLGNFIADGDLGVVFGSDGPMRLLPGLVRLPDVSFVSSDKLPVRGQFPSEPIAGVAPDLAVEVLSPSNTRKEMARKLKEYFLAGTRLVWHVDPSKRVVQVFTAPDQSVTLAEGQTLDGGDVLPGLALPLKQIFARVPAAAKKRRPRGQS